MADGRPLGQVLSAVLSQTLVRRAEELDHRDHVAALAVDDFQVGQTLDVRGTYVFSSMRDEVTLGRTLRARSGG